MVAPGVKFIYSDHAVYESDEPVIYDLHTHPAIQDIRQHFSRIREEVEPYMQGKIQADVHNPNAPNVNYPNTWKHLYFMNYMLEYAAARKLFPFTYSLLKKHPEITLAGIASLEAGGRLFPHSGETNAIVRCHLGIKIPGSLPDCGLRVKDEHRSWIEGDVVCFNDAFNHEAWNLTTEKRYILLFDIMRPEFMPQKTRICAYALALATVRYLAELAKVDKQLPMFIRKVVILPFFLFWYLFLQLQPLWLSDQKKSHS